MGRSLQNLSFSGCTHIGPAGLDGIGCRCTNAPAACNGQAIPRPVTRPLSSACGMLSNLTIGPDAIPKRAARKARKRLVAAERRAVKAARDRHPKITSACLDGLRPRFADIRNEAERLSR